MTNKLSFFIPSIGNIVFVVFFLTLLVKPGFNLLGDCDTGFHIRTGEYILENFSIPKFDIFSYSTPASPWMNHEWLSNVIMAFLHRTHGLTWVVVFFAFLISLTFFLLIKIIQQYKVNIIFATVMVLLVYLTSRIHFFARPHILSWIFVLIWYHVLNSFWYNDKNYLYLLPPIMLLWVNLHGSFILGFVLISIYLFGNIIRILRGVEKQLYIRKVKLLGLVTGATLLVSLINPYSYHILLYPFKYVSDKFIMDHINELVSPNFHDVSTMAFEFLLLLTMAIFFFSRDRLHFIELILTLFFTHMALYSARYIPLFCIIIAPILARHGESILTESGGRLASFLKKRANNIGATDAAARGYLWIILAVAIVAMGVKSGALKYGFDEKTKPVAAVEFLKRENLKGNMFNSDEFGDYIIYSAYPQYKVFIDGRVDTYGAERLKEFYKVIYLEPGWEKVIEKYDIKWSIFDTNSILSRCLMEKKDWQLIYSDKVASIFVRKIPENQDIANKYQNVELVVVEDKK